VLFTPFCCCSPSSLHFVAYLLAPFVDVLKKVKDQKRRVEKKGVTKKSEVEHGLLVATIIANFQIVTTTFRWVTTLDFQCYKPSLFSHL
jgi:hypothetical protein